MDLQRLQTLSGRHPKQVQIDSLQFDLIEINKAYTEAITTTQRNEVLNEGLFTALKIALGTAGGMGKSVAGLAADKVKKMAASVKELYTDAKAKSELVQLVKEMSSIIEDFKDIETAAPTILSRDPEIKKTMQLFSSLLSNTIATLQARQATINGVTEAIDIQTMMDVPILEVKNHMGDTEYSSFVSWKSACKKIDPNGWLDGDKDIGQWMVGQKPYKDGKTFAIGEWDGSVGSVFANATEIISKINDK